MKSDSVFKKIAGVMIVVLVVNASCRTIDASDTKVINSDIPMAGFTLDEESCDDLNRVVRVLTARNAASATIEEESDVSDDRDRDVSAEVTDTNGVSGDLTDPAPTEDVDAGIEEANNTVNPDNAGNIETSKYAAYGIANASDFVYIRSASNADSEAAGKLYAGSVAIVEGTENDWYKVTSGNVSGYIRQDLLKVSLSDDEIVSNYGTKKATVVTSTLNLRKEATENAGIVDQLSSGDKLNVVEDLGEWLKVSTSGKNGYVASAYVTVEVEFSYAISTEEERAIEEAKQLAAAKAEAEKKAAEKQRIEEEAVAKANALATAEAAKSTSSSSSDANTTQSAVSAEDEDLMYLACIIYAEAGSESYEGKVAVANVVLNRYRSSRYPNSIKGVITQSGQFSPYRTGLLDTEMNKYRNGSYASDSRRNQCVQAALEALNGNNNIGSRTSFNMINSTNSGYNNVLIIGNHAFW